MEQMGKRKIVFVSNYLNHHQIPFCRALSERLGGSFVFIQTEPMEEERVQMGWNASVQEPYLELIYEKPKECAEWIAQADVVLLGWTEDESCLQERFQAGKPVIRISERIYRTGQWKFISPKGLYRKYLDHVRYRKKPVYLLCAGGYVPSDYHLIHAYPRKMFCWGYFPETKQYDVDALMASKGWEKADGTKVPCILWAARLIELKHPELAIQTAKYLKQKGVEFHLNMIGGGAMEEQVKAWIHEEGLEEDITLLGFMKPEEVRSHMEQADVLLFTSDKREGWGAVVNEAMNSGCVPVADHMTGAATYLIRQGENGYVYRDGDGQMLFETAEKLVKDAELRNRLGRRAYETIHDSWNAEFAAERLCRLIEGLTGQRLEADMAENGKTMETKERLNTARKIPRLIPCDPAPVISEQRMFRYLTEK